MGASLQAQILLRQLDLAAPNPCEGAAWLAVTALSGGTNKGITDPALCIRPHDLIPTGYTSGNFPGGVIGQTRQNLSGGAGFGTQTHDLIDGQAAIANCTDGLEGRLVFRSHLGAGVPRCSSE